MSRSVAQLPSRMSRINYLIIHKDHELDPSGINSGAEMATRSLARALAHAGDRVFVAAQMPCDDRTIDGVEYWNLGPEYNVSNALGRASLQGDYHLISAGRAQPILESRTEPRCRSRVLITHDRAAGDSGINAAILSRVADRIICVSNAQREVLVRGGALPDKLTVLHNGVDLQLFAAGKAEGRDPYRLIFVGALVEDKGIHWLIQSFCELKHRFPKLTLDVYGSAKLWGRAPLFDEAEISRKVPGLRFHGNVSQVELAAAYRSAGICVIPSIWFDPFPLVALEAQACGCPVWAFDVGGLSEGFYPGTTGVLCSEIQPEALTNGLRTLLDSPKRLEEFSRRALELSRPRYTWEKVAAGVKRICSDAAAERNARSTAPKLKPGRIGVLSTWNQACGLATYARYLTSEFPVDAFLVLAEREVPVLAEDESFVRRCWTRGVADFDALATVIAQENITVLQLNCHARFFPQPAFAEFLNKLRRQGVRVVSLVHSSVTLDAALTALIQSSDLMLVHSVENRLELIANGAAPEITKVIPHGVHVLPKLSDTERAALRTELGIAPGETALVSAGFIQPHKGMDALIESVAHLNKQGVATRGIIVGDIMREDHASIPYAHALEARARELGVGDRVSLLKRFVTDGELGRFLQAADLVLMNYRSQYYEASGAASLAVGSGALVACSTAPAFLPFGDAVWHLTVGYPAHLAVELLLSNRTLATTILAQAEEYSRRNSWRAVCARLFEIYGELGFDPETSFVTDTNVNTKSGSEPLSVNGAKRTEIAEEERVVNTTTNAPKGTGLRVLMQNRPNAWTQPGGDTVVMEKTIHGLRKRGVEVAVDLEGKLDPAHYDVVHLFNFALPDLLKVQAERAQRAGVPFVVTTLSEDVAQFHNQSLEVARCLIEYTRFGQSQEWLKKNWVEPQTVKTSGSFDNSQVARSAAALLVNGAGEGQVIARHYPEAPVRIVPVGFDLGAIGDPSLFVKEFGVSEFVLCVGRLESRKNQLMLLKALEKSDITVVLAGGGFSYQPDYEHAVRGFKRRGKTIITGRLSPQLLASAYAACRVHALPSWYELPGLVSLEAASCGKNVVVTSRGTTEDYFGDLAFYCEPDNYRSVMNATLAAYHSPVASELRSRIGTYTWDAAAEATLRVYEEVRRPKTATVSAVQITSSVAPSAPLTVSPPTGSPQSASPKFLELESVRLQPVSSASYGAPSQTALSQTGVSQTPGVSLDAVLAASEEDARSGRFKDAQAALSKAEVQFPTNGNLMRARATIYLAEGDHKNARAYFEQALTRDPGDAKSMCGLGMCAVARGEKIVGHDLFARALAADPGQLTAIHQLIRVSYELNRYDTLEQVLRTYLGKVKDDLEIRFCLGGCLFKAGRREEARAIFEQVLRANPKHRGAQDLLQHLENNPVQTTIATTVQTIPVSSSWTKPIGAGHVPVASPKAAPAPESDKVSTPAPEVLGSAQSVELDSAIGSIEDKKRALKLDEAMNECISLLSKSGLSVEQREHTQVLRAELVAMKGDLERSRQEFEQILQINPTAARARCGLGALAAHNNRWAEALAHFEHALRDKPGYDVALAGLGLCAMQSKNAEKAWSYYVEATKRNPENLRAILGMIELAYPLKRLTDLEQVLRQYLEMHPADLQFLYSLAGCLFAQEKRSEARLEVEKILVFEPGNSRALELKQMIESPQSGRGASSTTSRIQ